MAKRKNDDDDRDDEKDEEQKKPDKDDKPDKPERAAGTVRARCTRACVVNGCYIKPGMELSFPAGRVNPHFEMIEE